MVSEPLMRHHDDGRTVAAPGTNATYAVARIVPNDRSTRDNSAVGRGLGPGDAGLGRYAQHR